MSNVIMFPNEASSVAMQKLCGGALEHLAVAIESLIRTNIGRGLVREGDTVDNLIEDQVLNAFEARIEGGASEQDAEIVGYRLAGLLFKAFADDLTPDEDCA